MQEYQCIACGYRKIEKDMVDVMAQVPMYSGCFGGGFIPSFTNDALWQEDMVCPGCGKASTWQPVRNNSK